MLYRVKLGTQPYAPLTCRFNFTVGERFWLSAYVRPGHYARATKRWPAQRQNWIPVSVIRRDGDILFLSRD